MKTSGKLCLPHIVVLAGGESARFDGIKQLATLGDRPMLQQVTEACQSVSSTGVHVVLGANSTAITNALDLKEVNVIVNNYWQKGMSSSIICAVNELQKNSNALLFIAADQIAVTSDDLTQLIDKWKEQPEKIICATFNQTVSLPVIFPPQFYSHLLKLTGDKGGKQIVKAHPKEHIRIAMPNAEIDIDTKDDATRYLLSR